jgi:4-hydroxy-3-polyprenylbenzoate decarboxylase
MVVGMTGASGAVYGYELVKALAERGKEVHLILSSCGEQLLSLELGLGRDDLTKHAHAVYSNHEMDSPMSSGSFIFPAMVVAPCSMRTLGAIASGISDTLISRVAEVCLKERRRLVVVPRETPLSLIDIRNMESVTLAGATVLPAAPAFYHRPESIQDVVSYVVGKVLDQLGVEHDLFSRWEGVPRTPDG